MPRAAAGGVERDGGVQRKRERGLNGEYIRKDEVREAWLTRAGRVVNLLRSKLEKELPPVLAGKDAPDIQELLGRAIDEVLADLHDGKGDSLTP